MVSGSPAGLSGGPAAAAAAAAETSSRRSRGGQKTWRSASSALDVSIAALNIKSITRFWRGASKISIVISSRELIKGSVRTLRQILHTPNLACFGNIPREEDSQPLHTHTQQHHSHGDVVCVSCIRYSQERRGNPSNRRAICPGQVF